jgi:hypothetical protein
MRVQAASIARLGAAGGGAAGRAKQSLRVSGRSVYPAAGAGR